MLSRICVPGMWGWKSRRFITLFQRLLRCYFRKRSSVGHKALEKCPLSPFLCAVLGRMPVEIPVHNKVRYTSFSMFLNFPSSEKQLEWQPRLIQTQLEETEDARTGSWCKKEFRTLMQMRATENIRLMACWDGVLLIRRNIWKLTPSPEDNNA